MSVRIGIFVTHPIQYFAPLWRQLSQMPGLEPVVHFFSDHSVSGGYDNGFGRDVKWDVPLVDGYEHAFLSKKVDLARPSSVRLPHAKQLIREGKFDAVLIHGYTFAFERQVARAGKLLRIPVLMRGEMTDTGTRSYIKMLARDGYLRWFYSKISRFCYIGQNALKHLQRHGIEDARMFFSPYSVDDGMIAQQRSQLSRDDARRQLGIDTGKRVVLFSGKLIDRKRPGLLLDALEKLDRSMLSLIILGDGEQRESLHRRATDLFGRRAILPGFVNQSQLGQYFQASDIFVLPSARETWGLVVNEAMHFGLPVIVSSGVGCHPDLVTPGETGFVFREGAADELAGYISALADDEPLRLRMRNAAEARVAKYTIAASALGVEAALRDSLTRPD